MPRSYANGKIYCIRNRAAGDSIVYVGSTTQALCERMSQHRCNIGRTNMKIHKLMGDVGVENFHIELINDFRCERRDQLTAEEGRHIRELRPECNDRIEGRTIKEWREDNADTIAAQKKAYYDANADTIIARAKAYREAHTDTIAAKKKAYNAANLEANAARQKAYYDANADTISARMKAYAEARPGVAAARPAAWRERKKAERLAAAATAALASIAIDAPAPA